MVNFQSTVAGRLTAAMLMLATGAAWAQDVEPMLIDDTGANVRRAVILSDVSKHDTDGDQTVGDKVWIGVRLINVPETLRQHLHLAEQGMMVNEVFPDSPASKAGLKQYDVLLLANGQPINRFEDFVAQVRKSAADSLRLEGLRVGAKFQTTVQPEVRPSLPAVENDRVSSPLPLWNPLAGKPVLPIPSGVAINISRKDQHPPVIELRRGDETWTLNADGANISQLPADLQPLARQLLQHTNDVLPIFSWDAGLPHVLLYSAGVPGGPPSVVETLSARAAAISAELARTRQQLGNEHPRVRELQQQLEAQQSAFDPSLRSNHLALGLGWLATPPVTVRPANILPGLSPAAPVETLLKADLDRLHQQIEAMQKQQAAELAAIQQQLREFAQRLPAPADNVK